MLAIFEEIGVNMVLYFLVFGESLLNDGVTIVFYNTFVALHEQQQHTGVVDASQVLLAIASLFTVVVGGLVIGLLIGALSALILRCTKVDHI